MKTLDSYLTQAKIVGNKTGLKKHRTETGIKDTIQEHFLEKLFASYKGKSGTKQKQEALVNILLQKMNEVNRPRPTPRYTRGGTSCCTPRVYQILLARFNSKSP